MGQAMEAWEQEFQELIQEVKPGHWWTLTQDQYLLPDNLKPGWKQYQQHGFARFQCSLCSRKWASANVHILFHMHRNEGDFRGQVKMRAFAQRCRKCSQPPFEAPEFTEENVSRLLKNLVFHILKKCYKEGFKSVEVPMIKEVSLEGPHDSHNCEACLQGFCAKSSLGLVEESPGSPTPPRSSLSWGATPQKPFPTSSHPIVETKKVRLPSPHLSGPTQAVSVPTLWSPSANTSHQEANTSWEESSFHTAQNCTVRRSRLCCYVLLVIIVIIIIVSVTLSLTIL